MGENVLTLKKARSQRHLVETVTDADNEDNLALHVNIPTQTESFLYSIELIARGIGLFVNIDKTEFLCFKQDGTIFTSNGLPLKLVEQFTYLGSNISSSERDVSIRIRNAWTAIDSLFIM